jgi:hypothetical protein
MRVARIAPAESTAWALKEDFADIVEFKGHGLVAAVRSIHGRRKAGAESVDSAWQRRPFLRTDIAQSSESCRDAVTQQTTNLADCE